MRPNRIASVLVVALASLFARPADAGLIGYWSFDGCTVTDASGSSAALTSHGTPTCVAGRFGNAWPFDGTDQWLDRAGDLVFQDACLHHAARVVPLRRVAELRLPGWGRV